LNVSVFTYNISFTENILCKISKLVFPLGFCGWIMLVPFPYCRDRLHPPEGAAAVQCSAEQSRGYKIKYFVNNIIFYLSQTFPKFQCSMSGLQRVCVQCSAVQCSANYMPLNVTKYNKIPINTTKCHVPLEKYTLTLVSNMNQIME
jgi:hypothetical protein